MVAHTVNMPTAYTDPFYCPVIWSVMLALDGFWDNGSSKGCHQKKIAEKETLVHKNPLFLVHQKGDIFLQRMGSKCEMMYERSETHDHFLS